MNKIMYIPLDERPCNYQYPQLLAKMTELELLVPQKSILGNMKKPANIDLLVSWMEQKIEAVSHLLISIDMLVYGGIVPSRLHQLTYETCMERLSFLRLVKEKKPNLKIFAFDLIMRVPAYNSSEEEPDYYEEFGEDLFRLGWLYDKRDQSLLNEQDSMELKDIEKKIPLEVQQDFLQRRTKNFSVTQEVLNLVEEEIIDYLIVPLDDNSPFGFSPKEQRELMHEIAIRNLLDKVNIYPGADEIGCTLFARAFCEIHRYVPEIFIRYSSTKGPFIIPKYEDRILSESIKSHIIAAGGIQVNNEEKNHFILMVHSPAIEQREMAEASLKVEKRHRSYFSEVNIREFVEALIWHANKGKLIAIADVAVSNGADHLLLQLLEKKDVFDHLISYAGWNTNGNTMGTVIAHAIITSYHMQDERPAHQGHLQASREFFYLRLVEDWGYQTIVRTNISQNILPELDLTPRFLKDQVDQVTQQVENQLNQFIGEHLSSIKEGKISLHDVYLPWSRMFEVGFTLKLESQEL
ncbi:DUF4127 family protein [Lederbergia galactosidilytica]|uniref:DUF4127 family protein n=1 Tax=Lederbergia galactosidilytica TaxID=217031 RepID=A0A177ZHG7_9BACI|nr:DUF4127 family protein [Lederbergia galactosidilytica]OAK67407.1 hypothetical protein ABB05_19880 [Lederbergia galactosidilytica]